MELKDKIKTIPEKPGVYIFKDKNGIPIYVGKATSLKKRVSSYFSKIQDIKTSKMLNETVQIEYIITNSEKEALLLEANLIKKYKPFYNIRLKDDKSYPYIEITTKDPFPRISLKRGEKIEGNKYFGPYTSAQAARSTIKFIRKTFKLRGCKGKIANIKSPCLDWHINLCSAPCIGKIDPESYKKNTEEAILFLENKKNKLLNTLKKRMQYYSERLEFEKAKSIRDEILELEKVLEKQNINFRRSINEDILILEKGKERGCIFIFKVREGEVRERDYIILEGIEGKDTEEIFRSFIIQYYIDKTDLPDKIVVEEDFFKKSKTLYFLKEITGKDVKLKSAKGKEKELSFLAHVNAKEVLKNYNLKDVQDLLRDEEGVMELKKILKLKNLPRKIEGFDISTLFGKYSVASMVSFKNGLPDKSSYRRFKIRYTKGINDFSMMYEVIIRRYERLKKEKKELPDLILIDGGAGQLSVAKKALKELDLDIPIISLAKKEEEIYATWQKRPLQISKNSPGLKLLQRIRDESHRFAITYHKKLRDKETTRSQIDKIPGIGEKRKREILKHFKCIDDLYRAEIEELKKIPGIGEKFAKKIKNFLKR